MCGRFAVETGPDTTELHAIIDALNRLDGDDTSSLAVQTGEVCPTHCAAILLAAQGKIQAASMRWGYPRWNGSGVIINARCETVKQRPLFEDAFRLRRIAIPTTGFYEWRHDNSGKQKEKFLFNIHKNSNTPLFLAGIYSLFPTRDGAMEPRFVILTTAANSSVASYHDRMPVLLHPDELLRWMSDEAYADAVLHRTPDQLAAIPADSHSQLSFLD